ncbi:hypothetical protein GCM10012280_64740 [Wenjunlia tyrosinilytica]|uniref:Uncharacterized protein n=1 Tax=Wenjunlia tyrosinilytica TaxID=1544741 RepID=A0A917ZX64_9ACTN|nr:hypothetical protein GCM10012280_64740 [Wenjunlia tyrosinilytica]
MLPQRPSPVRPALNEGAAGAADGTFWTVVPRFVRARVLHTVPGEVAVMTDMHWSPFTEAPGTPTAPVL